MNLSTMRTESRYIFGEVDAANSAISDGTLDSWANEAYRYICTKLESLPITERTYTVASSVTLNSNTITVDKALLNSQPNSEWVRLKIIDMDQLISLDPNWPNTATGQPQYFVRKDTFTALLYPYPDVGHDALAAGLKTYGLEMDTLSGDSDTPNLPINLHDIFPHYMAYRAFSRLQNQSAAINELTLCNSVLKGFKHLAVNFSSSRGWQQTESDE